MSIPVINRPRSALFEPHKCRDLKLGDAILKALAPSVTRTQYPCGMSGMQSQPEIDNRTGLLQAQPKAQMRTFGPREAECHKEQYRTHMSFQPGTGLSKRCKPEITRTHLTSAASHPRVQPRCPITPFFVKPSNVKPKFNSTFLFAQHGAEPTPVYTLRHLDPSLPGSKNRYAAGIYDAYSPDVLYAEVLLIPKWTQPSLSQEAIRQNGGVPPPPEPILPNEFVIQLYNPDQQVLVRHRPKTWNSAASWEFEMPQQTFRQPSSSKLDRTMSDPAASDITPKLKFIWRKDGKLSRDLGCYMSGKKLDDKKGKEPDITVAILRGFKEVTLYEPNLYRVEIEDFKGLEVVLLLGAIVIRDVYFGHIAETFHISDPPNPNSLPGSMTSSSQEPKKYANQIQPPTAPQRPQAPIPERQTRPPPADPRTQWEIDAETARLKKQAEAEAKERRRREKEAEKETKRLLEAEQREARRRQAAIDQETERLKKIYGREEAQLRKQFSQTPQAPRPNPPPRPASTNPNSAAHNRYSSYIPPPSHTFAPPHFGVQRPSNPQLKERRSIFGLFKKEDGRNNTISRKRSSMF
ncbi:conserved hypothetical protein [Histoplasma capsulatum G186AR]|uniref:Uncharacterized protein n=1 Tax=Ajellomyces capsulatus (strain G186AR / H82 / ATCC MYA-2454 / RMSCC 2432) TaxID=447093 RepID=C0NS95_AJECG|nr:uncharacterized protein HCBG_06025 [Histoplasma capsulatum G186AR]EEH05761.1 conserved hypothetical protein [Histoplasma capsulatum G186AR]